MSNTTDVSSMGAPEALSIGMDLRPEEFVAATELYLTAFHAKTTPIFGPPERTARFFAPYCRADRAIIARQQGQVIGIAGFKQDGIGLFNPPLGAIFQEYGWSAPLRILGAYVLERQEERSSFLMDGIAVAPQARGKGVGTKLLQAIEDQARRAGKTEVRLDVIDTNPDARRLYERLGFVATGTLNLGPLAMVFPFKTATTMIKELSSSGAGP